MHVLKCLSSLFNIFNQATVAEDQDFILFVYYIYQERKILKNQFCII